MHGECGGAGVHLKPNHPGGAGAEGHGGRPVRLHSPDESPGPAAGNTHKEALKVKYEL